MKNPYWHELIKPHVIDSYELRETCFQAYSIIQASRSQIGLPGEEIGGNLDELFFQMAEDRLSALLLNVAIKLRTFEDLISDTDANERYRKFLVDSIKPDQLGSIGTDDQMERIDLTLREACNKIIHAEDIRPVYENGSKLRDEDFAWGMVGTIELAGRLRGKRWDVWLEGDEFLSACLDVARFIDELEDGSQAPTG